MVALVVGYAVQLVSFDVLIGHRGEGNEKRKETE